MPGLQGPLWGKLREKEPCGTPGALGRVTGIFPTIHMTQTKRSKSSGVITQSRPVGWKRMEGAGREGRYRGPGSIKSLFQKKTLNVLGPALSDSSATVSPLLGGRLFSNRNCHLRNFPMSPISPCFVGSCQLSPSAGRFVISQWFTAPGLSIN